MRAALWIGLLGVSVALGAAPPPQPGRIAELVKQLGDDDFEKREAAGKELEKIGTDALGPLHAAATSSGDLEVRRRASRLYRKLTARLQLFCYEGHTKPVQAVAFAPEGRRVLSASYDGTVRLLDVPSGKLLRCMKHPMAGSVAFTPDGRKAISGSNWVDPSLRVWELETCLELKAFVGYHASVYGVAVAPDGKKALFAGGRVGLLDIETGREVPGFAGHAGPVWGIALSADGTRSLSGGDDRIVRLWDNRTGKELLRLEGHRDKLLSAALSPDGKWAVSCSMDGAIKLWDLATGKEVRELEGHPERANLTFSPDGRRIAGGSLRAIHLWDARTGKELHRLGGHAGWVSGVKFSPDGRLLVSGSEDQTVRLWRVPR